MTKTFVFSVWQCSKCASDVHLAILLITKMDFQKRCSYWSCSLNIETANSNVFLWTIAFSNQYFRISLLNKIYLGTIILWLVFSTQKAKCAKAIGVCQFGKNFSSDVAMSAVHRISTWKVLITYMIHEEIWMLMTLCKGRPLLFNVWAKLTCKYFSWKNHVKIPLQTTSVTN